VYYQWQKLVAKSIIEQLTLQICIYVLNPKPFTPTKDAWNIASPTIEGLNTRHQQTTINHIPMSHYLFFLSTHVSCISSFPTSFQHFLQWKMTKKLTVFFLFFWGGNTHESYTSSFPLISRLFAMTNDNFFDFGDLFIYLVSYLFICIHELYIASFPLVNFQESLKWKIIFDLE
jgi:hypothetical protein